MGDDDKQIGQIVTKSGEIVPVSPYSLFSSDNPGALITSVQLKGDNYNEWTMEMMNALRAKKKAGFIDGSLPKPKEDGKELEAWLSVNSMIVGWIRSFIEPRVRSTVTFITEAHKLWDNLKKRFDVGNKVRVHQLMEQLVSCRQNGQAVIDYYRRMAVMWEELQTYRPPPACTCSAATAYEKEREDERVHQFIMGLDDSRFGNVVTAIIEAYELPDLGKVYAKVIREEARLNSSKNRETSQEAIGFVAKREIPQSESRDSVVNGNSPSTRGEGNRAKDKCAIIVVNLAMRRIRVGNWWDIQSGLMTSKEDEVMVVERVEVLVVVMAEAVVVDLLMLPQQRVLTVPDLVILRLNSGTRSPR